VNHPTRPTAYITTEITHDDTTYHHAYNEQGKRITKHAYTSRDQLAAELGTRGYNPIDEY
jgi:hypothetical protein